MSLTTAKIVALLIQNFRRAFDGEFATTIALQIRELGAAGANSSVDLLHFPRLQCT